MTRETGHEAAARGRKRALQALWLVAVALLFEATTRVFFRLGGEDIEVWRQFSTTRESRLSMTDEVLGARLVPSAARNVLTSEYQLVYRTNSLGLREREIAPTTDVKVLFLGDSQTFGEGVETGRRYTDLLGERLGVFSINAGVPGYGLHQMVGWFELEGWKLRPDLVVCALIESDLDRTVYPMALPGPPHVLRDPEESFFVPAWLRPSFSRFDDLARASYLYAFLGARLKIALLWHRLERRDRQVWDRIFSNGGVPVSRPEGAEGSAPVRGVSYPVEGSDPRVRALHEAVAIQLLELERAAAWSRTQLLVANIDDHPLTWLEAILAAHGIDYWDASTALRGQTGVRHRIDPHYTAKGHALLAANLAGGLALRLDAHRRSPGPDADGEAHLWDRAKALCPPPVARGSR